MASADNYFFILWYSCCLACCGNQGKNNICKWKCCHDCHLRIVVPSFNLGFQLLPETTPYRRTSYCYNTATINFSTLWVSKRWGFFTRKSTYWTSNLMLNYISQFIAVLPKRILYRVNEPRGIRQEDIHIFKFKRKDTFPFRIRKRLF